MRPRAMVFRPFAARQVVRRYVVTVVALALLAAVLHACAARPPEAPPPPQPPPVAAPAPQAKSQRFEATAYSVEGKTAGGQRARPGIVAADPKVLPIGTRIRVSNAGSYSGEYTVADTGRTIRGHEIDIYIANDAEARRFGRRTVHVEVLSRR